MNYLKIHDWDKWQKYRKDRGQPPWIKIYRRLLRNLKWIKLSDAERGQLVSIWMLAADHDGQIPPDPKDIKTLCHLNTLPNINKFIELGYIDNHLTTTCQPSDRPDKIRLDKIREETDAKAKYLDCVFLLDEEVDKLIDQFGQKGFQNRIQTLNDYIMSKGKKYKSHYHTILNWERRKNQDAPRDGPNQIHISMLPDISADAEKRDIAGLLSGIGKEMK